MQNIKLIITIAAMLLGLTASSAGAAAEPDIVSILNERESALVTLRYVLTVNMNSRRSNTEQEHENELTCTMISSGGLLTCSNNQLSGFVNIIKQVSGAAGNGISATPKNMEVLVGPEAESFDVEIVARDTELDMVWLQISEAGERSFAHVDFSEDAQAEIGDPVIMIRRTGNNFGRIPVITQNHIGGIASKPRKLYIPGIPSVNNSGLPVFTANGRVLGLMVTQLPDPGDSAAAPGGLFGAGMANLQDALSGLILPASEVVRVTRLARQVRQR